MAFFQAQNWHEGENRIHSLTGVPLMDNPTSPFLTPRAAMQVQRYSIIALGTLDSEDRPWTTVWGGEPPLAQAIAQSVIGIKTTVDATYDPVIEAIFQGRDDGEVLREEGSGRMISGVSTELEERGRVKLYGRMIAGALNSHHDAESDSQELVADGETGKPGNPGNPGKAGETQLVIKIEQSLANCPKYLNKKHITSYVPSPKLVSNSTHLPQEAIELVSKADLFFLSSSHEHEDMDSNHRGGPQGFLRVYQPEDENEASSIIWPEYSGNNLYQTLGNFMTTPKAGLAVPDFETGDVLYVTGKTEVLVGKEAANMIAKSTLAVKLTIDAARYVKEGLPFRGTPIDDGSEGRSPYNPRVRYLTSEKTDTLAKQPGQASVTAKLIKKTKITPNINRYRFSLSDPKILGPWKPGQYVAFDLSRELDMGYSHMRDDDPTSLNDDFIRTFTVSSIPGSLGFHGEEFEITVRNVGSATGWLAHQREGHVEADILTFGGEFRFDQTTGQKIGFIAAGIGITPLLGQMGELDLSKTKIWWSVGIRDVGLVQDIMDQYPALKASTLIFLTGDEKSITGAHDKKILKHVLDMELKLETRRLLKEDLIAWVNSGEVDDWYLCTAPALRKQVQAWMPDKSIVFENFDY